MTGIQHGGNLDAAIAQYGDARQNWLDLSTGINPVPYPIGTIGLEAWSRLPERSAEIALLNAARHCYDVHPINHIVAAAGVQAVLQLLPKIVGSGSVCILGPTYGEYAAVFASDQGHHVAEADNLAQVAGSAVAVVCNPNNPDGRRFAPEELIAMARDCGILVVDEAFGDVAPELSLCGMDLPDNLLVLRSFGKFFGLAGLRLGFAIGHERVLSALKERLGPWAVSGIALQVGARALADMTWVTTTRQRLAVDMKRLRKMLQAARLQVVGGCDLFVTVEAQAAPEVFHALASNQIWVRSFDYNERWLRFGLPGDAAGWSRLEEALSHA